HYSPLFHLHIHASRGLEIRMSHPFLSIHDLAPSHLALASVQPCQHQRWMRDILASSSLLQGLCDIYVTCRRRLKQAAIKNMASLLKQATFRLYLSNYSMLLRSIAKTLKIPPPCLLMRTIFIAEQLASARFTRKKIAACFSWRRPLA